MADLKQLEYVDCMFLLTLPLAANLENSLYSNHVEVFKFTRCKCKYHGPHT